MPPSTVVIGSDHAGVALKALLAEHLRGRGIEVRDLGPDTAASVDYPDYAKAVCAEVLARKVPGVLICGTGQGMAMTANKLPGIRAAVCCNEFHARMARMHNDANVLCLGERVTGPGLALDLLDIFVDTDFEGGRHSRRIDKIEAC
jgi:ribose 5-phosphate isomerase B